MITAAILVLAIHPQIGKASELYADCKSYIAMVDDKRTLSGDELFAAGRCFGYMSGFGDGANQMRNFCAPTGTTLGTIVRVYLQYLDSNPKLLDSNESQTAYQALSKTYPCKSK